LKDNIPTTIEKGGKMARRRRSKVIRNFTEKTALDTVVKAQERVNELESKMAILRNGLERCRDLLNVGSPSNPDEWTALKNIVSEALEE
jgi:hypothetical protein